MTLQGPVWRCAGLSTLLTVILSLEGKGCCGSSERCQCGLGASEVMAD